MSDLQRYILGTSTLILTDNVSEIKQKFGPPDLALLPISAGSVLPYLEKVLHVQLDQSRLTSFIHCTPKDAIEIHREMGCRRSMGIHWGTFTTLRHTLETERQVNDVCEVEGVKRGWEDGGFWTGDVGVWLDM